MKKKPKKVNSADSEGLTLEKEFINLLRDFLVSYGICQRTVCAVELIQRTEGQNTRQPEQLEVEKTHPRKGRCGGESSKFWGHKLSPGESSKFWGHKLSPESLADPPPMHMWGQFQATQENFKKKKEISAATHQNGNSVYVCVQPMSINVKSLGYITEISVILGINHTSLNNQFNPLQRILKESNSNSSMLDSKNYLPGCCTFSLYTLFKGSLFKHRRWQMTKLTQLL